MKRPSRSISASPIGSTSSRACRLRALPSARSARSSNSRKVPACRSSADRPARGPRAAVGRHRLRQRAASIVLVADFDKIGKSRALALARSGKGALEEQAIGGEQLPVRSATAARTPACRAARRSRPSSAGRQRSADRAAADRGNATTAGRSCAPTRSTSTGQVPALVAMPATHPAPSRHAMVSRELEACCAPHPRCRVERRPCAAEAFAIGGVGDKQRPLAVGQRAGSRHMPSADPTSA